MCLYDVSMVSLVCVRRSGPLCGVCSLLPPFCDFRDLMLVWQVLLPAEASPWPKCVPSGCYLYGLLLAVVGAKLEEHSGLFQASSFLSPFDCGEA